MSLLARANAMTPENVAVANLPIGSTLFFQTTHGSVVVNRVEKHLWVTREKKFSTWWEASEILSRYKVLGSIVVRAQFSKL